MTNRSEIINDPIQFANVLKAFAELRQSNAISENEYDKLKTHLLSAIERSITSDTEPGVTSTPAVPQFHLEDFAGDIHRAISDKLAREYPKYFGGEPQEKIQEDLKRYLTDINAMLLEKTALHQSDMPHMHSLIETVMQQSYACGVASLAQGLAQVNAIHKQVRLNGNSSPLAKTISGIASDSATKAVEAEAFAPPPVAQPPPRSRWWHGVTADVTGAITAAGATANIFSLPGIPLGSLAALVGVSLGLVSISVTVLGAVLGAGMMSGMELARSRP